MTSEDIVINSNNFSVDKYGNMTCRNANISGNILVGGDEENPEFVSTDGDNVTYIFPLGLLNEVMGKYACIEKGGFGAGFVNSTMSEVCTIDAYDMKHKAVYDNTSSSSSNVYIDNAGYFHRATGSSKRWKKDITENIEERLNPEALYNLPVVQFKYNDGYLDENDTRNNKNIIGFIAEDVAEVYEPAVEYDTNGQIEMWNSNVMIPAMLKLIQEQKKQIDNLQIQINELKGEI